MSAINLYTTKSEALYFKDSQRNNFYEFGGIQLLPNTDYYQKFNYTTIGLNSVKAYKVSDDSLLADLTTNITVVTSTLGNKFLKFSNISNDFNSDLIYLKIEADNLPLFSVATFKTRVLADVGVFENEEALKTYLGIFDAPTITNTYYSIPFYLTANNSDMVTNFKYSTTSTDNYSEIIGLKVWFRQKSRQSELTTYYESSTKNTVTQAIKTHNLEMYESEFMSIEDLILTAQILESPYLYIGTKRYSLFEAVKIPELTQQENFGKIKFTLAPNN
jgi:hypothetical protein